MAPTFVQRAPAADIVIGGPPYDGKPCIVCPIEVRDLAATASNFLGAYERGEWERIPKKAAALRESLARLQPITDAHFADRRHSHP